ncbi:MAG: DUF5678 domain-containing protein [Dehalococcoidia bacterium]
MQETQEEVQQDLERFTADMAYFDDHRDDLLRRYPEQWVAVYNQLVVGANRQAEQLIMELKRQGIRPGRVYREYLSKNNILLILAARSR